MLQIIDLMVQVYILLYLMRYKMKKRALFIDDHSVVLLIGELMLKDLGYEVFIAKGRASAVKILKNNSVDLIILDLMMPDINGLDFFKSIKKNPKFKHIPIIIQTGMENNNKIKNAYYKDIHFLLKPYSKQDLSKTLKSLKFIKS